MGKRKGEGERSDTTPGEEDLVLEKETIIDLDVPEPEGEDVRGGARNAEGPGASNANPCCRGNAS